MGLRLCRPLLPFFLALTSNALAVTTWYVNGASGSDSDNCMASTSACKTIGHAISLASAGDSIMVAAATYKENLTIGISLRIVGASAGSTIIDGGGNHRVITLISSTASVTLANLTIQNGFSPDGGGIQNDGVMIISHSVVRGNSSPGSGGGIYNNGILTLNVSTVSGNKSSLDCYSCGGAGGGILNYGTLTINDSTISGNTVVTSCSKECVSNGGGISNGSLGKVTINRSTVSGNTARAIVSVSSAQAQTNGGGISNLGSLTIINSTIANNTATGGYSGTGVNSNRGGGIESGGTMATLSISSSTITGNSDGSYGSGIHGGGIFGSVTAIQNSIVANNSKGNCSGAVTSMGYNLSSDDSCKFSGVGDANNVNPVLGPLQNNGGPTQTLAILEGSPAIDAGNPSGCRDNNGNLLRTDQRGYRRHDAEDTAGCDIGAFERQSD